MLNDFPQAVKVCLWSYDIDKIDMTNTDHRSRIIQNVLNRGTKEAVDWLFLNFSKDEIANTIKSTSVADWNKKSLSLWSLIFNIQPARTGRFV